MQHAVSGWLPARFASTDALLLNGIVLLVFVIYGLSPVTTSTDSAWTFHVAASILRQGNTDLDEYRSLMDLELDYRLRSTGGHIYSYYPIATPLLVAPAVWLANAVYPLVYRTDFYMYLETHAPDTRTAKMEKWIASAIAALTAGLIYLIARGELGIPTAVLVSLIFALCTSMWSTASRALWQHGPSALFLTAALYLLLRSSEKPALWLWVGLLLGCSYLLRPTNSLSVIFVGLYAILKHRRQVGWYASGVGLVLVPFMVHNWLTFHAIFPPYAYVLFERLATPRVFVAGLAGTLVSPGRGLFIFSPVLLWAVYGAYLRLRHSGPAFDLHICIAAILIAHWITISVFEDWGGAWSIGPRYFSDVIPYLIYFLIPAVGAVATSSMGWKYAFITAMLLSALIQFRCSTSTYAFLWNGKPRALVEAPERLWDWSDLQFLRGFCPRDPLEGRAPACWFQPNG